MKKFMVYVLVLLTVFGTMCGSLAEEREKLPLGRLTKLGISEESLNAKVGEGIVDLPLFSGFRFFDTYNSMVAALDSGIVGAINIDEYMADYLVSHTDNYVRFSSPDAYQYQLVFSMLLREEDSDLCERISQTIADMKNDGTLDALRKKYIDDCIAGTEPEATEPQQFEGAQKIRVALTGDRPPMDYFSEAGSPIGFNTALVSEVARRLEINVEFVSVNSGARAISLASKTADIVFWSETGNFDNWEHADTEDQPENTIVTVPYLTAELVYVVRADSPLLSD